MIPSQSQLLSTWLSVNWKMSYIQSTVFAKIFIWLIKRCIWNIGKHDCCGRCNHGSRNWSAVHLFSIINCKCLLLPTQTVSQVPSKDAACNWGRKTSLNLDLRQCVSGFWTRSTWLNLLMLVWSKANFCYWPNCLITLPSEVI